MTRVASWLALLVAAAALVWWLVGSRGVAVVASPVPQAPAAQAEGSRRAKPMAPAEVPAQEPLAASPLDADAPGPALAGQASERALVPEPASATRTLRGTWIAVDAEEREHRSEDGWFELYLDDSDVPRRIEVRGGAWEARCPVDAAPYPGRLALGERSTVALDQAHVALAAAGSEPVELLARWIQDSVLHVVDAASGAELDGVEVVVGEERRFLSPLGTDVGPPLCESCSSPVVLPPPFVLGDWSATERIWARAPGYAWGSLNIPRGMGGDFVLGLAPGGALRVEVRGVRAPLTPFLRLRDPRSDRDAYDSILYEEQLAANATVVLESLRAGTYRLSLDVGHGFRYPREIDAREVVIGAAPVTNASLDAGAYHPPPFAELSGELVLPPEWEIDDFELHLELVGEPTVDGWVARVVPRDEMELLDAARGRFAWSFGELQVGSYALRFDQLGTLAVLELPAQGLQGYRFEIPPPLTLTVEVIDERTGERVEDVRVMWIPDQQSVNAGGALVPAQRQSPGRFHLRSPAGKIEVWCLSKNYRFEKRSVELTPGPHELRIETRPAEGILLRVERGESPLPHRDLQVSIREVGGDGEGWLIAEPDFDDFESRFVVTHPGTYRIELGPLPGHRPIEPREVLVPEATFVEVTLAAVAR